MNATNAIAGALGSLLLLGGSLIFAVAVGKLLHRAADLAAAPCRCSHPHSAHEHSRDGTDCALCSCARYRAALPVRVTGICRCGKAFDGCSDPILHATRR